jgi:hypothetical protein
VSLTRRRAPFAVVLMPLLVGLAVVPAPGAAADQDLIRADLRWDGAESAGGAWTSAISSDGNTVVWQAKAAAPADDPVPGPAPAVFGQLYARDLDTGVTERISVSNSGETATYVNPAFDVSGDGNVVVFSATGLSGTPETPERGEDVYVRDRRAGTTTRISVAVDDAVPDAGSGDPHVSDDGRWVVFSSSAGNLLVDPPDDPEAPDSLGTGDVFLHDMWAGTTTRVSPYGPINRGSRAVISADGTTVAYVGSARDPVTGEEFSEAAWVVDRASGATSLMLREFVVESAGQPMTLSGDGRFVTFVSSYDLPLPPEADTARKGRAFLLDRETRELTLLSRDRTGAELRSPGLVEVSDDGRFAMVASSGGFGSPTPLTEVDVYLRDLAAGTLTLVGTSPSDGVLGGKIQFRVPTRALSRDASRVSFLSAAGDLVPGDTNGLRDVFVRTVRLAPPGSVEVQLKGDGEPVTTGAEATEALPVVLTITPPRGLTGPLRAVLQPSDPTGAPTGYAFFESMAVGSALALSGPAATAADPYRLTLTVDASLLGGITPSDVQIFRNGAAVPNCPTDGSRLDPCVIERVAGADGDAVVTVLTSAFSTWELGRLDYELTGPLWPVKAYPEANAGKAGQPVVVPFRLGGNRGTQVLTAGSPSTAACTGVAAVTPLAPGTWALAYVPLVRSYLFTWLTPKRQTGCRDLHLGFRDGSQMVVRYQLR